MRIKRKRDWELPESAVTPRSVYLDRRRFMGGAATVVLGLGGAGVLLARGGSSGAASGDEDGGFPAADLYPAERNTRIAVDRPLTAKQTVTTYNNFYEFGSHKEIWRAAQSLPIQPWTVRIDGMVEEERTVDVEQLIRSMPLEERIYRLRCVEAWAMTVPWSGFPLAALVDYARPLSGARFLRMETFGPDQHSAPGFNQFWYPWPYIEGLTMDEATNELAFMATGLYGEPLPRQNGAPLRLAVPWKYGFKSIKSIVRFTFTDERPVTFWEDVQGSEYGFWANVNPDVPHPRWSQATERLIGTDERVPTRLYNGYEEYVAHLYKDFSGERRRLFM